MKIDLNRLAWDAVVVGGGPAGSGFAHAMANRGKRVVVLEKNHMPSSKVCGGVLSPRCLRALQKIGFANIIQSLPSQKLQYLEVEYVGQKSLQIPFPSKEPICCVVDRTALDDLLWNTAKNSGAEMRKQTFVKEIIAAPKGGWHIGAQSQQMDSWIAPILIGADGRHSFVARQLGLVPKIKNEHSVCFQYCLKQHEFDRFGAHFFIFEGGYCGLSVDGTRVAHLDVLSLRGKENESALMERLLFQRSSFVEKLEKAKGLSERPLTRSPVGSGWRPLPRRTDVALLGDAQQWVEPFTGEGITLALESAYQVAESICHYGKIHRFQFSPSFTNYWVAQAVNQPWLARMMIHLLNRAPSLARWMAKDVLS